MYSANDLIKVFASPVIILVAVSFSAGVALTWGLPKLWAWVKPLIHAATG